MPDQQYDSFGSIWENTEQGSTPRLWPQIPLMILALIVLAPCVAVFVIGH